MVNIESIEKQYKEIQGKLEDLRSQYNNVFSAKKRIFLQPIEYTSSQNLNQAEEIGKEIEELEEKEKKLEKQIYDYYHPKS